MSSSNKPHIVISRREFIEFAGLGTLALGAGTLLNAPVVVKDPQGQMLLAGSVGTEPYDSHFAIAKGK